MTIPLTKDVELPLLIEIDKLGGEARPSELHPRVTTHFPQITEADLQATLPSGSNAWTNRIGWARHSLVAKGELDKEPRGIWRITEKGRQRIGKSGLRVSESGPTPVVPTNVHEDLKRKMVEIGSKLGYRTNTEERWDIYQHDVLWKEGYKRDPSHVIEVCYGGSLQKDFDALSWAVNNLGARGILIVVDDADYRKAVQRFEHQDDIVVVKAEIVDRLCELVETNLEFLKAVFQ